jgi:hypothetical protein
VHGDGTTSNLATSPTVRQPAVESLAYFCRCSRLASEV